MKAIVHIGTEKTGSTTIQAFLHTNRHLLRQQGVAYLRSPGLRNQRKLAVYCMEDSRADNYMIEHGLVDSDIRRRWKDQFRHDYELEISELPPSIHTVLFSSEHFHSRLKQPEEVQRLYSFLATTFSEIQIVVYLRRQDQVALSLHSTKLISGGTPKNIFPRGIATGHKFYDYYELVHKWSTAFGRDNISIRIFDRESLRNNSLIDDFIFSTQIHDAGDLVLPPKLNEKLSRNAQFHLHRFNRKYPRFWRKSLHTLNDQTRKQILKNLDAFDYGPNLLPTRNEAKQFYDVFKESNNQLAREFLQREQLFAEDFWKYPKSVEPVQPTKKEINSFDSMTEEIRRKIVFDRLSTTSLARVWRRLKGRGRTLYLHIGSHKTGSTSIQRALVSHKAYLAQNGIHVFHSAPDGQPRAIANVHPWIRRDLGENLAIGVADELILALGAFQGNTVVSSEMFSDWKDEESINHLVGQFRQCFDRIKVIVYLRRQDKHAVSHHQQGSRHSDTLASQLYGSHPRALPTYTPKLDSYLDYNKRLGLWGNAVGDKNVIVRIFDKNRLHQGDAVDDILHVFGLKKQHTVPWENESSGFVRSKVGHLMNQEGVPLLLKKTFADSLDGAGKLTPSRAQALEFYEHYKHSNLLLNQRFKLSTKSDVFDSDFSMYPETAEDQWDEDTANLAISNIVSAISSTPTLNREKLMLLRQGAERLFRVDRVLSDRLLRLTKKEIFNNSSDQWTGPRQNPAGFDMAKVRELITRAGIECPPEGNIRSILESLFPEDLSMNRESPQMEWNEETANAAIRYLLGAAKNMPLLNIRDSKLIENCSQKIEESDPQLAKEMREIILGQAPAEPESA